MSSLPVLFEKQPRQTGYYWVLLADLPAFIPREFQLGLWDAERECWWLTGAGTHFEEDAFEYINEEKINVPKLPFT